MYKSIFSYCRKDIGQECIGTVGPVVCMRPLDGTTVTDALYSGKVINRCGLSHVWYFLLVDTCQSFKVSLLFVSSRYLHSNNITCVPEGDFSMIFSHLVEADTIILSYLHSTPCQ